MNGYNGLRVQALWSGRSNVLQARVSWPTTLLTPWQFKQGATWQMTTHKLIFRVDMECVGLYRNTNALKQWEGLLAQFLPPVNPTCLVVLDRNRMCLFLSSLIKDGFCSALGNS